MANRQTLLNSFICITRNSLQQQKGNNRKKKSMKKTAKLFKIAIKIIIKSLFMKKRKKFTSIITNFFLYIKTENKN